MSVMAGERAAAARLWVEDGLEALREEIAPCLILMDEVAAFVRAPAARAVFFATAPHAGDERGGLTGMDPPLARAWLGDQIAASGGRCRKSRRARPISIATATDTGVRPIRP